MCQIHNTTEITETIIKHLTTVSSFFSIFRESSLNTSEKENDESKLSSGSLAHFYDVAVPGEDDDDEDDNDLSRDNSLDDLQQQQQVRLFYLFIVSVTFS